MPGPVYLDYHATTPVDPRVLERMLPYFGARFGNAASRTHSFGWEAEKAVDVARRRVAALAGASPAEIVFTSGATESNNLALKGVARAAGGRRHIVTVETEHRAVLDPARRLREMGHEVTILGVRPDGLLDLDELRRSIRPETLVVSVMWANNETGVIQPVAEIGAICRENGVLFHSDAAQAFGKVPVNVEECRVDLMSVSAHKMCGPKGTGALYVRRRGPRVALAAEMEGGGHERGMRSGTLNVPAIVGLGEACALAAAEMEAEAARVGALRDGLLERLRREVPDVVVNGSVEHRLAGNLNVAFPGVSADSLLTSLPDVAISSGSACSSATPEPSHVLRALGMSREAVLSSVRIGLGRFTTGEEIDFAGARIVEEVGRLRALTPA